MIKIRYMEMGDQSFWFALDHHISQAEFENKVRTKRGYVLLKDAAPVGILRYNLFWDNTPFCTMLFIAVPFRRMGYGKMLMQRWEEDMKRKGYDMLLTSTRVDETAQHFYRKLGFQDCGSLMIDQQHTQPMELFLQKKLRGAER